jgi:hypothetical protein
MYLRYDLTYTTKELSRVLQQSTKTANDILRRALRYAAQTKDPYLLFSHDDMQSFVPPKTLRKPTDVDKSSYDTQEYNVEDGIQQPDDKQQEHEFTYTGPGEHVTQTCMTDIDLAGQIETRQSASGTMNYLNGVLVHWRDRTERLIVHTTAAGEYIALSRGNTTAKYMRHNNLLWQHTKHIPPIHRQPGSRPHSHTTQYGRPQSIN